MIPFKPKLNAYPGEHIIPGMCAIRRQKLIEKFIIHTHQINFVSQEEVFLCLQQQHISTRSSHRPCISTALLSEWKSSWTFSQDCNYLKMFPLQMVKDVNHHSLTWPNLFTGLLIPKMRIIIIIIIIKATKIICVVAGDEGEPKDGSGWEEEHKIITTAKMKTLLLPHLSTTFIVSDNKSDTNNYLWCSVILLHLKYYTLVLRLHIIRCTVYLYIQDDVNIIQ